MMGCENLVIARTDSESGKLISSAVDVRDHEFIKGVTEESEPLAETLQNMEAAGAPGKEIDAYEAAWVKKHKLVTFDEAVVQHLEKESASQSTIDEYLKEIQSNPDFSLLKRRAVADKYTKSPVYFNWDIPRTREGFYHYKAGMAAATKRGKEFAPYADSYGSKREIQALRRQPSLPAKSANNTLARNSYTTFLLASTGWAKVSPKKPSSLSSGISPNTASSSNLFLLQAYTPQRPLRTSCQKHSKTKACLPMSN
jgi:hypothetical protein